MKTIFLQAALIVAALAVPGPTINEDAALIATGAGNYNATDAILDERSNQRISFKACYQRSWAVRCCGYGSGRHRYHCQDGKFIGFLTSMPHEAHTYATQLRKSMTTSATGTIFVSGMVTITDRSVAVRNLSLSTITTPTCAITLSFHKFNQRSGNLLSCGVMGAGRSAASRTKPTPPSTLSIHNYNPSLGHGESSGICFFSLVLNIA